MLRKAAICEWPGMRSISPNVSDASGCTDFSAASQAQSALAQPIAGGDGTAMAGFARTANVPGATAKTNIADARRRAASHDRPRAAGSADPFPLRARHRRALQAVSRAMEPFRARAIRGTVPTRVRLPLANCTSVSPEGRCPTCLLMNQPTQQLTGQVPKETLLPGLFRCFRRACPGPPNGRNPSRIIASIDVRASGSVPCTFTATGAAFGQRTPKLHFLRNESSEVGSCLPFVEDRVMPCRGKWKSKLRCRDPSCARNFGCRVLRTGASARSE